VKLEKLVQQVPKVQLAQVEPSVQQDRLVQAELLAPLALLDQQVHQELQVRQVQQV
jgi:hypothetical protein